MFYRDTCRREATARGVAGSAANLDDGSVEVVLEGEPRAVEALVDWARCGPDGARVEHVDVHDEQPQGVTGFSVRGGT